jgi:hypothetical protein
LRRGAMLKANLWSKSAPRVELDRRARETRLRLEQIERLLVPRAAMTPVFLASAYAAKPRKVIKAEGS